MNKLLSLLLFALLSAPYALAFAADDYVDFDPSKATPTVNAPLFVIVAYSAIWLAVIGFALLIWRRQKRVEEELQDARQRLAALRDEGAE